MSVERSQIKVNQIVAQDNSSPVLLGVGATVSSGYIFHANGGVTVTGIATASQFVGDGTALTGLPVATVGNTIASILVAVGR